MTNSIKFLALGGAGEIGMNCYLYGYGHGADQRWIMVDCGVTFGDMARTPGIELIFPDVSFIAAQRKKLEGIFITHAHEDHVGAIGHLWKRLQAPVYATSFTAQVIRHKLSEADIENLHPTVVSPGEDIQVGPFTVRFHPMTHSIPDTSALLIQTPLARIFHSSDFKMDRDPAIGSPIDEDNLRKIGDSGITAMICDSTNIFEKGESGSENSIRENLQKAICACEGAVAATTFASNIGRLRMLAEIARSCGREVVVVGRAMLRMIEMALRTGMIKDFPNTLNDEIAAKFPRHKLMYLVTGSQGEQKAALARISQGTHPAVRLREGDCVLYSARSIPGNERDILDIMNRLVQLGVKVVEGHEAPIHVSGHAYRDELRRMYQLIRPGTLIPTHGEYRHLVEHQRYALESGIPKSIVAPNGSVVKINESGAEIVDRIETGKLYLDGKVIIHSDDGVVRDRLRLARNGVVVTTVVIGDRGEILGDCEVRVMGIPAVGDDWPHPIEETLAREIDKAISGMDRSDRRHDDRVEEVITKLVKRTAQHWWGRKPEVIALCLRMDAST